MGMAGSFFEPQPCNFGKIDNFLKYSNDISTIFWNSSQQQTCRNCQEVGSPGNTEVHGLAYQFIDPITQTNVDRFSQVCQIGLECLQKDFKITQIEGALLEM